MAEHVRSAGFVYLLLCEFIYYKYFRDLMSLLHAACPPYKKPKAYRNTRGKMRFIIKLKILPVRVWL